VSDSLGREEAHGGCHHNEDFAVANQKGGVGRPQHNLIGCRAGRNGTSES